MVRHLYKTWAACALVFLSALASARAQDVWGGGFPNDDVDVPTNWAAGVVPPGYTSGTDVLEFTSSSNPYLNLNVSGVSFSGLQLTDTGEGASAYIYGANGIAIGTGGIAMTTEGDDSNSLTINTSILLTGDQHWTTGNEGDMQVTGPISGAASITIDGGSFEFYEFDSGTSSFSGGLTVLGDGTVLIAGATGTPFGTGPLLLADGVWLQPQYSGTVVLPNNVTFGNITTGNPVYLGNNDQDGPYPGALTFNGNAIFNYNGIDSTDSEIDLMPNTTVIFNGSVDGASPGVCIDFGTNSNADETPTSFNSQVILRGDFGTNVSRVDLEDSISVILDGNPSTQTTNVTNIGVPFGTYLGLGASYIGHVGAFLSQTQIDQPEFQGTLGFDNTTGGTSTFSDAIDLTNFDADFGFAGLGSATKAILTGLITPPGGLGLQSGTNYLFGGGGGHLQVTSALTDSTWTDVEMVQHNEANGLTVLPGNGPLTLELSGPLSFTGGVSVDGGVLVFDTVVPTVAEFSIGENHDVPGYVGVTTNSQFVFDGSGGAGTHPQNFVSLFDTESQGVIGFEGGTVSAPLDVHTYPDIYLGTSTSITYSGTIVPYSGTFQFAGVKGGAVTVDSPSLQTGSSDTVVVGLPTPIESYGSVSQVYMTGNNYYSGGTTLNSGYLYVDTYNSIGSGALTIAGQTTDINDPVGLAPRGTSVQLGNAIVLENTATHLNYAGSPYTLTLTGDISNPDGEGNLIVDGPVELDGNNSFEGGVTVNGTTFTVGSDNALFDADFLEATAGSTLNFTSPAPEVSDLDITGTVVSFTGSPIIDELSMQGGSHITFAPSTSPVIDGMNSDSPASGNLITLGTGTALTFNLEADPDYHGTIVGPNSSSITLESGTLNLIGANSSFSGAVAVQEDAVLIASNSAALGTGPVTVQTFGTLITNTGVTLTNPINLTDGGVLAGFGTFAPTAGLAFQNGSILVPGTSDFTGGGGPTSLPVTGMISFGSSTPLTFGTGGVMVFSLVDATGSAGAGYSTVDAQGGLTVTATSIAPFVITILSFAPGTTVSDSTAAINFNSSSTYSWTLASSPTTISGFNPADFLIDTSEFVNSTGTGYFFVSDSGTSLVLNFSPVPEPSTWALMGCGALVLAGTAWRRRTRASA